MTAISEAINEYKNKLKEGVQLIAVSKTFPNEDIEDAYACGQRDFAENKVQELTQKYESLPKDIKWHMIGHLQTNKVKYIAPFIHLIHAVDSLKLLETINKEGIKNNRTIKCLMQVYIAQEDTKYGMSEDELYTLLRSDEFRKLTNVEICGLMGVASFTDNEHQVAQEFTRLKNIFDHCKETFFADKESFKELSMGMTHDFIIAQQYGATLVRIGNGIFGKRYYQA